LIKSSEVSKNEYYNKEFVTIPINEISQFEWTNKYEMQIKSKKNKYFKHAEEYLDKSLKGLI
jgi:hypothetical protein